MDQLHQDESFQDLDTIDTELIEGSVPECQDLSPGNI